MISSLNMISPDTKIIDESFNSDKVNSYHLNLYGGRDGLSLAILDSYLNKFIAFEEFTFNQEKDSIDFPARIGAVLNNNELIGEFNYKQVNFCYAGNKSTLVPDPLFNSGRISEFLSFNFNILLTDVVHADQLNLLRAKNIFAIPVELEGHILKKFPRATIHHHATPFIESILLKNKNRDEKIATVHIHLTSFEMVVTKRNELVFYNSFEYHSTEDFLYFVLFTLEQLQLNPETIPFIFTGSAGPSSALYINARKYLRFVGFGERPDHFSFSDEFASLPSHYNYVLFNQHLCVS